MSEFVCRIEQTKKYTANSSLIYTTHIPSFKTQEYPVVPSSLIATILEHRPIIPGQSVGHIQPPAMSGTNYQSKWREESLAVVLTRHSLLFLINGSLTQDYG